MIGGQPSVRLTQGRLRAARQSPLINMSATLAETTGTHAVAAPGKYLTFLLGGESYGIPVLKVREIIRHVDVTTVPQMPSYVKGVTNLRGKIIPVVDLRIKFGLPDAENSEQSCVVVVQVQSSANQRIQIGLVVDGVEEVANISAAEIEPTPDFGGALSGDTILGMAKVKGRVKALLDIERVVGLSEEAARSISAQAEAAMTL